MRSVLARSKCAVTGIGAVLLLVACAAGCGGEAAGGIEAVSAVGSSARNGEGAADSSSAELPATDRIRRGGEGPESILEFGLFGPVVPTLESEGYYQSDCRFQNDPYETCL